MVHGLLGLSRAGARGRAIHFPILLPPFPIPNKPYGFCERKAACLLTYLLTIPYSPYGLSGRKATFQEEKEEEEAPTHRSKQDRHHQNNRPVLRRWGASQCKAAYALRGLLFQQLWGTKAPELTKVQPLL